MKSGLRVLIVDDNQDFADCECGVLTLCGCDCRTAVNVATGVETAAQFQPDMVLFDLGMPGDGGRLPGLIRQLTQDIPTFVAVSGFDIDEQFRQDGIDYIFRKPASPDDVVGIIDECHRDRL